MLNGVAPVGVLAPTVRPVSATEALPIVLATPLLAGAGAVDLDGHGVGAVGYSNRRGQDIRTGRCSRVRRTGRPLDVHSGGARPAQRVDVRSQRNVGGGQRRGSGAALCAGNVLGYRAIEVQDALADDGATLKVGQIEILAVGAAEGGPKQRIQRAVLIDRKVLSLAGLPILRSELEGDRHHCTHIRIGHFLIFLPGALEDLFGNRLEQGIHRSSPLRPWHPAPERAHAIDAWQTHRVRLLRWPSAISYDLNKSPHTKGLVPKPCVLENPLGLN